MTEDGGVRLVKVTIFSGMFLPLRLAAIIGAQFFGAYPERPIFAARVCRRLHRPSVRRWYSAASATRSAANAFLVTTDHGLSTFWSMPADYETISTRAIVLLALRMARASPQVVNAAPRSTS
jgi:hypothetical protein